MNYVRLSLPSPPLIYCGFHCGINFYIACLSYSYFTRHFICHSVCHIASSNFNQLSNFASLPQKLVLSFLPLPVSCFSGVFSAALLGICFIPLPQSSAILSVILPHQISICFPLYSVVFVSPPANRFFGSFFVQPSLTQFAIFNYHPLVY